MFDQVQVPGFPGRRQRGFTIVEIVIAFIIIGILTLVMVPVLSSRANDARLNAAQQDLEHLANAQERACTDTGYMYRPYVLNDVPDGDGFPNAYDRTNKPSIGSGQTDDVINGIRDNGKNLETYNIYNPPTYRIFISQQTQDYLTDMIETALFSRMTGDATGQATGDLISANTKSADAERKFNWNGPYINWRRDVNQNDWPDDPWGHDYLFFTKAGVLYPPSVAVKSNGSGSGSGSGSGTGSTTEPDQDPTHDNSDFFRDKSPTYDIGGQQFQFPARWDANNAGGGSSNTPMGFDRPTWVSLGPDGIPGSVDPTTGMPTEGTPTYGFGHGDDLFRSF